MKKAVVIGLGVSGRAAAEFLLKRNYRVVAFEKNEEVISSHPEIQRLRDVGLIALPEASQWEESFDLLIPSPGVPHIHPLYQLAKVRGVEICGEAELAFRSMQNPSVAITGTNGKTTVTLLVEHILKLSGKKAKALGNVGEPLTTYFLQPDAEEIVVAELSSYQLETMTSQVFDAGILLNVTPDHLDRYASMNDYAQAKCRLQECIKKDSPFYVYEAVVQEFGHLLTKGKFLTFGSQPSKSFWTDREKGYFGEKVEYLLPLRYREYGAHERENALAAWLLVKEFGVTAKEFVHALESFSKPAHRIEFVAQIQDVVYFDDSKGTNLDAVIQAVRTMERPVILIAGGVDKGASYIPWVNAFQKKVKRILTIGQAAPKMEKELGSEFAVEKLDSLKAAVERAHALAEKGDCVLLSPGCSSFDMFRDYAHRGEEFKRLVYDLRREE
jgi:UDP-N-acetylmuramoylalanine--D-glutamate ligase